MRQQTLAILRQSHAALADAELLAQFVARRDEAAFAALVQRYGPLVLGLCRRLLAHEQDAEDAFQATFLVLARKAGSIRRGESLSCWLHGVARRTALRLKAKASRRPEPQPAEHIADGVAATAALREALRIFDDELARLPADYRAPLLLCYLEGKTHDEAARQLGWSLGTFRGRLERGREKLRDRLTRRGISVPAALVGLGLGSAAVPSGLAEAAVAVVVQGTDASAAVVSAVEGVCRAMVMSKIKNAALAISAAVVIGIGTITMAPGRGPVPAVAANDTPARPDPAALVKQLGHAKFAEREAAQARLKALGAAAADAVWAGRGDGGEVATRCEALWPQLWQAEGERPDAERLAGYSHPLWTRFRKVAGDDTVSRTVYAEMVGDVRRFARLAGAEADPATAGDAYAAELAHRVAVMKQAYRDAEARSRNMTGLTWPEAGIPSRGELAAVLFLGTYPASAAVAFKEADDHDRVSHHNLFSMGLSPGRRGTSGSLAPPTRRLFTAWLATRSDAGAIQLGTSLALSHGIADALPTIRKLTADANLAARTRGLALLAVGRFGTAADLPLLEAAFADGRVFHTTNYTSEKGVKSEITALVSDAAVAAALALAGQEPADFGFTFFEMYKARGRDQLAKYYLCCFFDNDARMAAHARAEAWLAARGLGAPVPEPSGGRRATLNRIEKYIHASDNQFGDLEDISNDLIAKIENRDDRACIYFQLAHVYAQSDIRRFPERVTKHGDEALKLSRDPVQRGTLHSYLASAAEVDPAGGKFPERRRRAVQRLLTGYKELLTYRLPKVAPELPVVEKLSADADPAKMPTLRLRQAEQMAARRQAEVVRELVHRRDTFVEQLRYLYGIEPRDPAELRKLIEQAVADPTAATELVAAVSQSRR